MADARIGMGVWADGPGAVDRMVVAERAGIGQVWIPQSLPGFDVLALFAAAAARTDRIRLGTSIVPVAGRHPTLLAQQSSMLTALSGGRFELGIGPGNLEVQQSVLGERTRRPLTHLREYVSVLRRLLAGEAVDHHGAYYDVTAQLPPTGYPPPPLLLSGLNPGAMRLAGEVADGVIAWMCPPSYLADVALPALRSARPPGATEPRIVVHVPVAFTADAAAARAAMAATALFFLSIPAYRTMFAAAGYSAEPGELSPGLVDALLVHGDEDAVAQRLAELARTGGYELLVGPIAVHDGDAEYRRLAAVVGALDGSAL